MLVDVGRGLAARLRAAGADVAGWTDDRLPELHADPRAPVRSATWQAIRVVTLLGRSASPWRWSWCPTTPSYVMWKVRHPRAAAAVARRARAVAQHLPARGLQPDAARARAVEGRTAPPWLKEYGFVIGAGLFIAFVRCASWGSTTPGPASALLLLGALSGAYVGGTLLKGKSGWCSSICPLLPAQRLYGQTPYKLVANSHCTPCVGCTKNCYDFNPKVAFLADLKDPDPYWSGYKKLFAAAFPGLVIGFFNLPEARSGAEIASLYGQLGALPRRLGGASSSRSTRC